MKNLRNFFKLAAVVVALVAATMSFTGCVGTYYSTSTTRKIQIGMTKAEVVQLMGKPDRVVTGSIKGSKAEKWIWNYGTFWGGLAIFLLYLMKMG